MKHILFILTSANSVGIKNIKTGYEFSEVADPYFAFFNSGYTVDFASLLGGTPPEDGYESSHKNSKNFKDSNGFKRLGVSHKLSAINIDAYDAIFFPGGLGPMVDMVDNPLVKESVRKVYESGRIVGAVCHGPVALLNVRLSDGSYLINGKKVCCFTSDEEKAKKHFLGDVIPFFLDQALTDHGALVVRGKPFEPNVTIDNNLITGQNPASATFVATEMIRLLSHQSHASLIR